MRYNHFDMLPERAFQRDVSGRIKPQGGGGGSSQPSQTTVTSTSIPEYAQPYVERTLGQAAALTDINRNPYQPYTGQRTAAFTPLQTQAMRTISEQQIAPQITDASNIAYTAGTAGIATQPVAQQLQQEAQRFGGIGAGYGAAATGMAPQAQKYGATAAGYGTQGVGIGSLGVREAQKGFGAGEAYQRMATDPTQIQAYMSPYMQSVVEQQQRDARRQSEIERQGIQAQAAKQGAFGGSRSAIVEAERQKNLEDRLAQIQATGSQAAFDKAQQAQQFGAGLGLQGLQAGYQGLQTGLAGTSQGIQGQQAGLAGLGQAGQLYGLGITGAQAGMQGVQGAVGAGQYGLAGLGAATQAAQTLGGLGQTQFVQDQAITDAQMRAGAMQQAQEQRGLDLLYQQYLEEMNYPYKQIGFLSDMYRGLPMGQTSQSMYQNPSAISQIAGLGTTAYGLYGLSKAPGAKAGGRIREGDGLDTLGMYNAMKG